MYAEQLSRKLSWNWLTIRLKEIAQTTIEFSNVELKIGQKYCRTADLLETNVLKTK